MQSKMEDWFVVTTPIFTESKFLKYFYLHKNINNIYEASWVKTLPDDIKYQKEIKWKQLGTIILCSNFECNGTLPKEFGKKHFIPILKSNLQKCIRRNDTENALRTSRTMMQISFIEFIRRLSIIMLEDVVLNESFLPITWFIAAYPHFQPNISDKAFLYGIVKYLSELKVRDYYEKTIRYNLKENINNINKLSNKNQSLIYTLQFRASYGGLKGDEQMINNLTEIWEDRIKSNNNYIKYITASIKPYTLKIKNIKKNEINTAAVDFHCYPKMLKLLQNKFTDYSKDILKQTVWFHRSRITYKLLLEYNDKYNNHLMSVWDLIKKETEDISTKYLINL